MKTTITTNQFLEQIKLGAPVLMVDGAFELGVQVGRKRYVCNMEDLNGRQKVELERLYLERRIRFAYPGDFVVAPYFFKTKPRTRIVTP